MNVERQYRDRPTMFRDLHPQNRRALRQPHPTDVSALIAVIRPWHLAQLFTIDLVGSTLDSTSGARDIDLVLRAQANRGVSLIDIETALIRLRQFGIHQLGVRIDPIFRTVDEHQLEQRIASGQPFTTLRLDAPGWVTARRAHATRGHIRPIGSFMVSIRRTLPETNYYSKLPVAEGRRVLRPARPLVHFPYDSPHQAARP